jgi:hypothetical protein
VDGVSRTVEEPAAQKSTLDWTSLRQLPCAFNQASVPASLVLPSKKELLRVLVLTAWRAQRYDVVQSSEALLARTGEFNRCSRTS